MMNPIGLVTIALGVLLLLFGAVLMIKRMKMIGVTVALLGMATASVPFVVTYFLAR